jgi:hypothetical protein
MIEQTLNVWLNVAAMLSLTGFIIYITCLSSTTWFGEDD